MQASLRWLKALYPKTPDDVAARLIAAGLEVEATRTYGAGAEKCVIAWVVETRAHPKKPTLTLVTVDRGNGTMQEVVCGAPNVPAPGGVVVLAPLGAHLPAKRMTIERREIAGVVSEGMLCSEAELGLTDDAAGILVLPKDIAPPGTLFVEVLPEAHDTVFEIGLTPNRSDGLGHVGLAREIAALVGDRFSRPTPEQGVRVAKKEAKDAVRIEIEDANRCPHYGAAIVEGVSIGPSPLGVRYRLNALGIRSISTAVDVTNLVMMEYGHPLHAFDLDKVRGGVIRVRCACDGEKLTTLDGIERTLVTDDLVICDAEGPIALAGVMGGAATEISESTKRVLIECAYFDPRTVRRTARRHGLHSESSHRFERGVDPSDTPDVLMRAAAMIADLGSGTMWSGSHIVTAKAIQKMNVSLRFNRVGQILGTPVADAESTAILERLGFAAKGNVFSIPLHRPDVTREIDLIEEVARVRGMSSIPTELPHVVPTMPVAPLEDISRSARNILVALGLSECITYSFIAESVLEKARAPKAQVILKNPLSLRGGVMRTSLVPGLLEALSRARRYGERDVRMFSVGRVFVPEEKVRLSVILAGDRPSYLTKPTKIDLFDAKGVACALIERLLRRECETVHDPSASWLHPSGAASVRVEGQSVGVLGPIHPDVGDALDLDGEAFAIDLDLEALAKIGVLASHYVPLPRFPASTRDLAIVIKDDIAVAEVLRVVREAAGAFASDVELFDRWTGQGIPEGHASLAIRITYRVADRTLTDKEVEASHASVVSAAAQHLSATVRA